MAHTKPHFNKMGGCLCRCRKCVGIRMSEHNDHVDIRQKCICKRCTQDCPSDDRIVFVTVPKGD